MNELMPTIKDIVNRKMKNEKYELRKNCRFSVRKFI